jgi:hypothetical protein
MVGPDREQRLRFLGKSARYGQVAKAELQKQRVFEGAQYVIPQGGVGGGGDK